MTSFTEFVETLRRNSVSSIGIEFHPPQTVVAGENDTVLQFFGKSIELPGVKACMINFFPPQTSGEPTPAGKKTPQEPIAHPTAPAAASAQPVPQPAATAPEQTSVEPEKRQEPEMPVQPEKRPVVEAEKPAEAAKPKRESKKKAEAPTAAPEANPDPQAATLPKPVDVYDVFVETVEQDDGTKSDVKRALIGRMTLDDMLRVNAGFQLGLDTDVATEALRAELLTCFI